MDSSTLDSNPNPNEDQDQSNSNNGWKKVTYAKRHTKKPSIVSSKPQLEEANGHNVFRSIEAHAEDRMRAIKTLEESATEMERPKARSRHVYGEDDDSVVDYDEGEVENGKVDQMKKVKPKKVKKPKITVAEAASKINLDDLSAFIADISVSYESQQDIQLMRFADYFGRAFSAVSASQFPWAKLFRESTLVKILDVPISQISEPIYKTSVEWINQRSPEALATFVLWSLENILTDLAYHPAVSKGSKKAIKQPTSKSQVAIFVVLAMVLRRKPDVLVSLLPTIRENSKFQGQDKLPVIVWVIAQASRGDLPVGLLSWVHNLLPAISVKTCNPQSRDLVLQLVERILSFPKAHIILLNGAVRKGERLIPPSALDILMRVTFPSPLTRIRANQRFENIYPTLKEVALAGSLGSKAMKQISQQILSYAIKAAGESNPELSAEASRIFIWSLTQNADCYQLWDKIYLDNIQASVSVLRKLTEEWKEQSIKLSSIDSLRATLKSFKQKNEEAMSEDSSDVGVKALVKESDKYCKVILGKLSRGHGCLKGVSFVIVALAVCTFVISPDLVTLDWKKNLASLASYGS